MFQKIPALFSIEATLFVQLGNYSHLTYYTIIYSPHSKNVNLEKKRNDQEQSALLTKKYDFSMIKPIPYGRLDFSQTGNDDFIEQSSERVLFKKRPPKKKKIESVINVDHELIVYEPRDKMPSVDQFIKNHKDGRLYGVVDEKHLIMYKIEPFELLDLKKK